MTLFQTLDKLAKTISEKASEKGTTLEQSIDAFKALTAYYAVQQKRLKNRPEPEADSEGFSFAGNDEVSNGSREHPEVRARRKS